MQSSVAYLVPCILLCPQVVVAQESESSLSNDWELESIRLHDGQEYRGLLLTETKESVEFAAIVRRPGRSMFTVVMGIKRQRIDGITRLEGSARDALIRRYNTFKYRVPIMLGQMEELDLREAKVGQQLTQTYEGTWFRLTSTANDEMTRRCIVRIEQVMRAFRQTLPPRVQNTRRFDIQIFGSSEEYRRFLSNAELSISNPAFYSASQNMIAAGCELTRYAERLRESREYHESMRRRCIAMEKQFADRKLQLSEQLRQQGLSSQRVKDELKQQTALWLAEKNALLSKMAAADRRNNTMFNEVTEQMFRRLYHETFHAYLENHVFPSASCDVPRWLNEGLAQVFESGEIDGDVLRIDSPDKRMLRALQRDLERGTRPSMVEMLNANDRLFLTAHDGDSVPTSYRLSWGVAYELLFGRDVLAGDRLAQYVSRDASQLSPEERFARLVGQPLDDFVDDWVAAVRDLR